MSTQGSNFASRNLFYTSTYTNGQIYVHSTLIQQICKATFEQRPKGEIREGVRKVWGEGRGLKISRQWKLQTQRP